MTEHSKSMSIAKTLLVLVSAAVVGGGSYHIQKWLDTDTSGVITQQTEPERLSGEIEDDPILPSTETIASELISEVTDNPTVVPEILFLNSFVGLWQDQDGNLAYVMDLETGTVWLRHLNDKSQALGYSSTTTTCLRAPIDENTTLMNDDRVLLQSDVSVYSQTFGETVADENGAARLIIGNATNASDQFRLMLSINDSGFTEYGYLRDLTEEEATSVVSECVELFG